MVQMGGAPRIVFAVRDGRGGDVGDVGREVMQQSGFRSGARLHDTLEVARFVVRDAVGRSVTVASASDENCGVDDERGESFEGSAETGQKGFGGPDIGSCVLGELGVRWWRRGGALKGRRVIEGAIHVVGAFVGVVATRLEGFDTVRPSRQVVRDRGGERACSI